MVENKKNNIIINREIISSEEVISKQNFTKILETHHQITKRPIYKQKKFYLVILLILLVCFLLYLSEQEDKTVETNTKESIF